MQLKTKTIQLPSMHCANREAFLYNVKKYVFQLSIENEELFAKSGLKNQYIHESTAQQKARIADNKNKPKAQQIHQQPLYVHSYIVNNCFTLNGYGQKGIDCLNIWLTLLKQHPEIDKSKLVVNTTEKEIEFTKTPQNFTYQSKNWIAYRNCKAINGFFYDIDKAPKRLVNFEKRIKKNIETFVTETCGYKNFVANELNVIITKIKHLGRKVALNRQQKEFFEIQFQCNYNLPEVFSLGQNVAYGNGLFFKIET